MHITHSFVGTTIGRFRYLFFALYEDYNDYGRSFVQEFNNVYLQRPARDLRDQGAVIQPFLADIETTRSHVLAKDWTDDERREITRVPSLLVISKDFDYFSPRSDPWLLLHFESVGTADRKASQNSMRRSGLSLRQQRSLMQSQENCIELPGK
jgi:hypothetical protein